MAAPADRVWAEALAAPEWVVPAEDAARAWAALADLACLLPRRAEGFAAPAVTTEAAALAVCFPFC